MGGPGDEVTALLTSGSPKTLIDKLAVERVISKQSADEMAGIQTAAQEASATEAASAKSAAEAQAAVDAAAAARAGSAGQATQLKAQMAAAAQQAVLTEPPAAVMSALGYAAHRSPRSGWSDWSPTRGSWSPTSWPPIRACSPSVACDRTRFPITRAVTPSTS